MFNPIQKHRDIAVGNTASIGPDGNILIELCLFVAEQLQRHDCFRTGACLFRAPSIYHKSFCFLCGDAKKH